MKKLFVAMFAVVLSLSSCKPDEPLVQEDNDSLYVTVENSLATKTYLGPGNKVLWSEGNQIAAFMKSGDASRYQVSEDNVGSSYAVFRKVSGPSSSNGGLEHNVAFYPYSLVSRLEQSGSNYVSSVEFPLVQPYAEESFGDSFFPMAAVSKDNSLFFQYICGAVKLSLTGSQTVVSVTLKGNSDEKISGSGTLTVSSTGSVPNVQMSSSATSSLTLDCGNGVQLDEVQATTFLLVVPPVEFNEGFILTVKDADGTEYEILSEGPCSVSRSNILSVPVQKLGSVHEENDAPEYIDENGVNHGRGFEIDGVIWAPVNCGYHETDYQYGKLYQWGRKYGQGYSGSVTGINGNVVGTCSDATVPVVEYGGVSLIAGNEKDNETVFYAGTSGTDGDWTYPHYDYSWNAGTDPDPLKSEYDPCPEGWRVPTSEELSVLMTNHSPMSSDDSGHVGHWFSGSNPYSSNVRQVFFPASGTLDNLGAGQGRGSMGAYWSSAPSGSSQVSVLDIYGGKVEMKTKRRGGAYSVRCVYDESELVPVSSVSMDNPSVVLEIGESRPLTATINPSDANHKAVCWNSDNLSVAKIDSDGNVTAVSPGVATVTAMAGMQSATCEIIVNADRLDYIDEYGVNHGKGIAIDGIIWAPVNCGYHEIDYRYGKLYQWGRKYGQGYSGKIYDVNGKPLGTYSDAVVPTIEDGGVLVMAGSQKDNENVFYAKTSESGRDWIFPHFDFLWNAGTESDPVKTEYDPCPEGWRVPTNAELDVLNDNHSSLTNDGNDYVGYWYSGSNSYSPDAPQIFFPAAGSIDYKGAGSDRGSLGSYWSSGATGGLGWCLYYWFNSVFTGPNLLVHSHGLSIRCVQDEDQREVIPVSSVVIDNSSFTLPLQTSRKLTATISPSEANQKTVCWSSDDDSIAKVERDGTVRAVSPGTTTITAVAGMHYATCKVTVNARADYIDEYGINHGPGIDIDGVIWAPVNCGYHETDFQYGKLYQWGRKYGQGYSGNLYDQNRNLLGTYADASSPTVKDGGVSLVTGQSPDNADVFFRINYDYNDDWLYPSDDSLWNSGTESFPVKTEYDPCPEGWRVPTFSELRSLTWSHSSYTKDENGHVGYWFCGWKAYSPDIRQIFLPASGNLQCEDRTSIGLAYGRGCEGQYWSSSVSDHYAGNCYFSKNVVTGGNLPRAFGNSVRCVLE